MINICCVYYGTKYSLDYVQVLYNMVERNVTVPYKFICFSDHVKPQKILKGDIEFRKFKYDHYAGWWNKLQMFTEESGLIGPTFYMDLDVVVLKNLDDMLTFGNDQTFGCINDFNPNTGLFNSSILKFNNENAHKIWQGFKAEETRFKKMQGDQNVISELVKNNPNLSVYPDEWTYSFKWHDRQTPRYHKSEWKFEYRHEAKVCVFHGEPNPHQSDVPWVVEHWK